MGSIWCGKLFDCSTVFPLLFHVLLYFLFGLLATCVTSCLCFISFIIQCIGVFFSTNSKWVRFDVPSYLIVLLFPLCCMFYLYFLFGLLATCLTSCLRVWLHLFKVSAVFFSFLGSFLRFACLDLMNVFDFSPFSV